MEDDHPTIAALHKATYGMLLFGIPHRGLVVDDIQKMLSGEDGHPRRALLEQIKQKSDLLASQLNDFKNLVRDRRVVSFYETGQTRQLQFVSTTSQARRKKVIDVFVTGQQEQAVGEDRRLHHSSGQRLGAASAPRRDGR
jgi:hypothetical protein